MRQLTKSAGRTVERAGLLCIRLGGAVCGLGVRLVEVGKKLVANHAGG